jgi:pyruvate kinase
VSKPRADAPDPWDRGDCEALIEALWTLRRQMVARAAWLASSGLEIDGAHAASAANLMHYLALREIDLRPLQERLARLGVSSLGRAETHVLASLDKVLGILHRLAGRPWHSLTDEEPVGARRGPALLQRNAERLMGRAPSTRAVRIMVTLPGEAAHDAGLIDALVDAGMDIARINCAHDTPAEWAAMAARVRKAARRAGRSVRILMDLGGPKLRTGPVAGGPGVVKLKPRRDALGVTTQPARLGLRPAGSTLGVAPADAVLGVDAAWLAEVDVGDRIGLQDARGARRTLTVVERREHAVIATCRRTAYLTAQTRLKRRGGRHEVVDTALADLPAAQGELHLQRGDTLHLLPDGVGADAHRAPKGSKTVPASIACTLPQALARVQPGERVWFDDGRIGAVVKRRLKSRVDVTITQARQGGERLAADKGINLPDTALDLPALTAKDLEDLEVVARHADLVGLSFCQSADDVNALRSRLAERGAGHLGLLLKIETRRAFEQLPQLLLAAMACPSAGVMIARGDLAVECGYERLAEVQEEILWACEAAHMPVVWATQVLETLAKTGMPSRAEITDAAMGERAECVMLNKGPHILDAMQTLDDILRRMQAHQSKKRPLLRALRSWARAVGAPSADAVKA